MAEDPATASNAAFEVQVRFGAAHCSDQGHRPITMLGASGKSGRQYAQRRRLP